MWFSDQAWPYHTPEHLTSTAFTERLSLLWNHLICNTEPAKINRKFIRNWMHVEPIRQAYEQGNICEGKTKLQKNSYHTNSCWGGLFYARVHTRINQSAQSHLSTVAFYVFVMVSQKRFFHRGRGFGNRPSLWSWGIRYCERLMWWSCCREQTRQTEQCNDKTAEGKAS